ncbi:hypothetical protein BO86DRAFT_388158 [Aspergillus japonicus CBS 114.51]|uniref:Uncharacterized protein n=1 Tax=Aspergillus japonicus CBS 114.51 TaxID=1448312 RepID=A0A8T8X5Q3_ASPJA|nr:hypothetical protein BO86DRAFT_388158 [Aspergillus japonicus CBS 114.51]RAH83290.1 hypothetical protein BO86DRAFT_388158 [Aspergillus japonicus CBS 114.51]
MEVRKRTCSLLCFPSLKSRTLFSAFFRICLVCPRCAPVLLLVAKILISRKAKSFAGFSDETSQRRRSLVIPVKKGLHRIDARVTADKKIPSSPADDGREERGEVEIRVRGCRRLIPHPKYCTVGLCDGPRQE